MTRMMTNETPLCLTLLLLVLLVCLSVLQPQVDRTRGGPTSSALRRKLIILNDASATAGESFPAPDSTIFGQPNMTEAGDALATAPAATAIASMPVEAGGKATQTGNVTTAAAAATSASASASGSVSASASARASVSASANVSATTAATTAGGPSSSDEPEALHLPDGANSGGHEDPEPHPQAISTAGQTATPPLPQPVSTAGQTATPPHPQPVSTAGQTATPPQAAASSLGSSSGCPREFSEPLPPDLSGRKFLMLAVVMEQMSKARLHLSETMALARLLNRTLVLPQVAHAADSIRYDHPYPACAYYDVERMGEMVPWMTRSYFLEQVERAEHAGRPISTKTIVRHRLQDPCGRDNPVWKSRQYPRSLFSRDMDDEKAERLICVANEDSAATVTREQHILKAAKEGGDADLLVLIKFTYSMDLEEAPIRVRFELHGPEPEVRVL